MKLIGVTCVNSASEGCDAHAAGAEACAAPMISALVFHTPIMQGTLAFCELTWGMLG